MGDIGRVSTLRNSVVYRNDSVIASEVLTELSTDGSFCINQKLNAFVHSKLKSDIGIRKYLYHIQNAVFTVVNKNILAVISDDREYIERIRERYDSRICKIVYSTWKKANVSVKYYYITVDSHGDGKERLNELTQEKAFVEKPASEIIYFNERLHKQTFDNFVSSEENLTALEVCQSIVCYSTKELVGEGSIIFLYGETSTGKTHLVNAMYNFYREKGGKIFSISATSFLRQYVDAVRKQESFAFRDDILKNEIIIIDDVDDLVGKNGTLHELRKLVAIAVENKKYIILTSKNAPNVLSERGNDFRTILSNAVSLKLKTQQDALKSNIAMNYICEKNMNVPISIVKDLIVNLNCNSRELKNYIKKLAIMQSIHKFELNASLALQILSDDLEKRSDEKVVYTNEEIIDVVAKYYGLSLCDLSSKIKCAKVCRARDIAMYLMRQLNSANFQEIGRVLNRNHSTVISGIKHVDAWLENDKKLPAELADIKSKLKK